VSEPETPSDDKDTVEILDHGFVRLDDAMADDLSVVNGARVSFARRKTEMDASDEGLIRFLMRDRHGSPFEHNAFRFHIRCPIFVAREWFRHRIGCLTGDAEVTFVNVNGEAHMRKTMEELHRMWEHGERDGHAPPERQRGEARRLRGEGRSGRSIARELGLSRRAVTGCLAGADGLRDARWRVQRMRVRTMDERTGEFGFGHIADVIDKGVQPVYRVTLADGKQLTLTENHRVFTPDGWRTMRQALGLVGDGPDATMTREAHLMINGEPAHRDRAWLQARRAEGLSVSEIAGAAGCSYHTVRKWLARHDLGFEPGERRSGTPWNKGKSGYRTSLRHSATHLDAIRRARSGDASNFWRGGVTSDRASIGASTTAHAAKVHAQYDYTCQQCNRRGQRLHAHHIAPVWLEPARAREIGNLITICTDCHHEIHATRDAELAFAQRFGSRIGFAEDIDVPTRKGFRLVAHPVRVVAVAYVGLRQTYDLTIAGSSPNFVANGIVVHNSFNEFSLRYAKATDDFYLPAPEDVRTQVGKPGAYSFETVAPELAEETRRELEAVYEHAFATYTRLTEAGVARELARSALPVGAYTQFYWTVNARALMNFVSLRNSEFAQLEIRRYAEAVEAFFAARMPVTHAAFLVNERVAP
jgi:thymidylate synthase (FAD)